MKLFRFYKIYAKPTPGVLSACLRRLKEKKERKKSLANNAQSAKVCIIEQALQMFTKL